MGILKKDYITGLDIGSSSIKLAQFIRKEDSLRLIGLKVIEDIQKTQRVTALKEAFSDIDVKNTEIIAVLNSAQAMVKRIAVPVMPYAELREALSLEAKNYFPFPVIDSLIDFQIIGETFVKGIKKTELLVGVCPNQIIKELVDELGLAGIRPSCLIHTSVALYSVLKAKGLREGLNVAALDIGKNFCELIIAREGKLIFSRKIPLCADDFTRALTAVLFSAAGKVQFSYDEAEKIKKEYGLSRDSGAQMIEGKITPSQLFSLLRPLAEKLTNEIERSFDFYYEEAGTGKVDTLMLFGGGAGLKGLDKFLSESLGIKVEVFSSLDGISVKEGLGGGAIEIHRAAVAVGAGLQGIAGINLLPTEVKQEMKRALRGATVKAGVSALLTILALMFAGMRIRLINLDKKITTANYELFALRQQFGGPGDWGAMFEILKDAPYCEDILKEISNVIPSDMYLQELRMQGGICYINGVVTSLRNPEEILSNFIQHLERGIFKNARSVTIQERSGAKEFEFQIECK